MASIVKRVGKTGKISYKVQIRMKGFPNIDEGFETENEAILFASQTESAMRSSLKAGAIELPKLPFSIWMHRWKEEISPLRNNAPRERKMIEFWENKLGNAVALDVTPTIIEAAADDLLRHESKKTGGLLSNETRRKYLLFLSSVYTNAIKNWKWAIYNPLTGVNMIKNEKESSDLTKEVVPNFYEFKEQIHNIIYKKMSDQKIFQREAANKSGMSKSSFQYVIDKESNVSISQLLKVFNAFGCKLKIEE